MTRVFRSANLGGSFWDSTIQFHRREKEMAAANKFRRFAGTFITKRIRTISQFVFLITGLAFFGSTVRKLPVAGTLEAGEFVIPANVVRVRIVLVQ